MIAFPLPPGLSTHGTIVAPRTWGCHACGTVLRRETCCQRVACWRFDDRGLATELRLDAPCDVPPAHCARCCAASAAPAIPLPTTAAGRAAA